MRRLTGRRAVHRAEHGDLGDAAVDAEPVGDRLVEVVVGGGGDQRVITRDGGQHPRLDLAEVGAHEHVPGFGRDGRPHLGGQVVQAG